MSATPSEVNYQPPDADDEGGPEGGRARKAMVVGRVIGWLLVLAGLAILGRDILGWISTGEFALVTAGELWFTLHNGSLNLLQAVTQRYIFPALWDPVFVTVLLWPAFLVIGVPGLVLSWVFRRRPRLRPKPA